MEMAARNKADRKLEEVQRMLAGLKGVKHCFYLTKGMRSRIEMIEKSYPSLGPLTVCNEGVLECLKKEHVACIVKDKSFRAPPKPTVLIVGEEGDVIGRELLPGEKVKDHPGKKTIFLGTDFVIYYEKGKGRGAMFVFPPVPFEEVERMEGVKHVISSSPSTVADILIKEERGLKDDPKLASILVGFDLR